MLLTLLFILDNYNISTLFWQALNRGFSARCGPGFGRLECRTGPGLPGRAGPSGFAVGHCVESVLEGDGSLPVPCGRQQLAHQAGQVAGNGARQQVCRIGPESATGQRPGTCQLDRRSLLAKMTHVFQALRSLVEHQHEGLEDGAVPVAPVAARSRHHLVNDHSGPQPLEERCRCHEAAREVKS